MYKIKKIGIERHWHTGEYPVGLIAEVCENPVYIIGAYPAVIFGSVGWVCLVVFIGDHCAELRCGQIGLTDGDSVWTGEITHADGTPCTELDIIKFL